MVIEGKDILHKWIIFIEMKDCQIFEAYNFVVHLSKKKGSEKNAKIWHHWYKDGQRIFNFFWQKNVLALNIFSNETILNEYKNFLSWKSRSKSFLFKILQSSTLDRWSFGMNPCNKNNNSGWKMQNRHLKQFRSCRQNRTLF